MKTKISQEILKNSRAVTEDDLKDISIGGNSTDVYLEEYGKTAKELGQIGSAKIISRGTHIDTIKQPGIYWCDASVDGSDYGYPFISVTPTTLTIFENNGTITQQLNSRNTLWTRNYDKKTNSWESFSPIGGSWNTVIHIYISKDGSDLNTGLDDSHPVLTFDRAIKISTGLCSGTNKGEVYFHFGSGEWGDISFSGIPFIVHITTYDGKSVNEYSESLPVFESLRVVNSCATVGSGIVAKWLDAQYRSFIRVNVGYKRFGCVSARDFSSVLFSSSGAQSNVVDVIEIERTDSTPAVIFSHHCASIYMNDVIFRLAEDINATFFRSGRSSILSVSDNSSTAFDLNGHINSGHKYEFFDGDIINIHYGYTNGELPVWLQTVPGELDGTIGYGCLINGYTYGQVSVSASQTITGSKEFTKPISLYGGSSTSVNIFNSTLTKGNFPTSSIFHQYNFLDNSKRNITGARFGCFEVALFQNGQVSTYLRTYKNEVGSNINSFLEVAYPAEGDPYVSTQQFRPQFDNVYSLGTSLYRWSQLYAGTTTIATSDEREKTNFAEVPEEVLDAWGEVNWQQYQFIDAVESKSSEKARLHTGIIAQRVIEVFKKYNLDASKYGLLCHDSWEAEDWDETIIDKEAVVEQKKIIDKPAEYDEEGNEISPEVFHFEDVIIEPEVSHVEHHHRDAGDRYGIRYEEALALESAYQRRRADRLEQRVLKLEQKLGI